MKPHVKSTISLVLGLAGLAILIFLGSWCGAKMARAGWFYEITPQVMSARVGSSSLPKRSVEPVRKDEVASAVKRLLTIDLDSPSLFMDWQAQAKIDGILAKLSTTELAAVYAGIGSETDGSSRYLIRKVGAAWMARDPDAAFGSAFDKSASDAQAISIRWASDDPIAALAWLNSKEFPKGFDNRSKSIREEALLQLLERDFSSAASELLDSRESAAPGQDVGSTLAVWGRLYADDPATRGRLIAFAKSTGHPEDYAALNGSLLRSWPQDDSLGMMTYLQELRGYLESDVVPPEARPKTDAAAVAAAIEREYTSVALEWWMERYSQTSETPAPLREAIYKWATKDPDAASRWIDQQPASPQRDPMNAAAILGLIARSRFAEAAQRFASIHDSNVRQPAIERLDLVWTASDPAAAAAWRATLPHEIGTNPQGID